MSKAVIVDGVRSAIGTKGSALGRIETKGGIG